MTGGGGILVTGATGYVGGRLLAALERTGATLRCLARRPEALAGRVAASTEVVKGDCLDPATLPTALEGVDTAYYLVHSMGSGRSFAALDEAAARNFGRAALAAGVRRIVYLGGLGAQEESELSEHLRSRQQTGDVLRTSGVPVVELRASIVIGSGSLSYEMVRALVERLPVMVCPRWVQVRTQPIGIDDLVAYVLAARDLPEGAEGVYEIGGPDVVSYRDIMLEYARQRGLRRFLIPVPLLTPRLSSLWLGLVTPLYARVGRKLIESLRNPTVVTSDRALTAFAVRPRPLREAIARALSREDADLAATRWSDALSSAALPPPWGGARFGTRLVDSRALVVDAPPPRTFAPVRRLGGRAGWYWGNAMWKLRGVLDLAVGGTGLRRGRRDPERLRVGEAVDFWRVEGYEEDRLLRLAAEMRLPGRAWLQFEVTPLGESRSEIRQTAIFDPAGLTGLLYWYALYPFHALIFNGLLRAISARAEAEPPRPQPEPRPGRGSAGNERAMILPGALLMTIAAAPLPTQDWVDLARYAGRWYEIARLPNRFQDQCVGDVAATYTLRPDGRVTVVNECRKQDGQVARAAGVARRADDKGPASRLKVRFAPAWLSFLPFVWGDYWIVELDPGYRHAVVGDPSRKYLWVLSRSPEMDAATYESLAATAGRLGFDAARLVRTPHTAR